MKIHKTVTQKVIEANRENSKNSTGPSTEEGKSTVSGNAEVLGIFGKNLRLKTKKEERTFNKILKALKQSAGANIIGKIMANVVAAETIRYARALKLDERMQLSSSPGNEILRGIREDGSIGHPCLGIDGRHQWQCTELSLSTGDKTQGGKGAVPFDDDDDPHVQFHAKFVNRVDADLRCQAAARRAFYKALQEFQKEVKKNVARSK